MNNSKILDITWGSILKIFFAIICFYFLFQIKDIIIWIVFAFTISLLFNPAIQFFNSRLKIPRVLAVIFVYLSFFGLVGLLIYFAAPMFAKEIHQFFQLAPQYFEKISPFMQKLGVDAFENLDTFNQAVQDILGKASGNIFGALTVIFGGLFKTVFTMATAFFFSLDEKLIRKGIALCFPKQQENAVFNILRRVQKKVGRWFGGSLINASFVGVSIFVILLLFNVKYAGLIGLLAGVFDFVPFLGPTIILIITFAIVSLDSLSKAVLVAICFILIQQIEAYVFVPIITKKFVGIPPFLVILSLTIGGALFGAPGAILAIPLSGIIQEFLVEYLELKRNEEQ